jgi:hypothetical protein
MVKHFPMLGFILTLMLSGHATARIGQAEDEVSGVFGKPIDAGKPDSDGVTTNMYKNPTGVYLAVDT